MRDAALLVEDEPDLLQVLTVALSRALPAVDVRVAESIAAADAIVAELEGRGVSLALVLADHQIAGDGRTGLSLIASLRARHPRAAMFLFTGKATPEVEAEARTIGARVLWKPLRLASLVAEVQGAMVR